MDEQFETRPLLTPDDLRGLITRRTWPSVLRLILHLSAFVLAAAAVTRAQNAWIAGPLSIALAWIWSGLFAPFHECTHRTAFRSAWGNRIGAWLCSIPFGMAPMVYRVFHYEHHRHTQDPERDPELMGDLRYAAWPPTPATWALAMSGHGLVLLKVRPLLGFALKPRAEWPTFARWAPRIDDPARIVFECRLLLGIWLAFLVMAFLLIPNGGWLIFAAWLAHVFQVLWVVAEHTGLPLEGSILARTRSVAAHPFVRFWIWNMNYHAEHHAWPSIPWHQLPAANRIVGPHLESFVPGYFALHRSVLAGHNFPSGDP